MIKFAVLFSILWINFQLFANTPPTYLGQVEGEIIVDLFNRRPFHIDPGKLENCERSEIGASVFYTCAIQDAIMRINDAKSYTFHKLVAIFSPEKKTEDLIRDYTLIGSTTEKIGNVNLESKVRLRLYNRKSDPVRLTGYIEIEGLGVRHSIIAGQNGSI